MVYIRECWGSSAVLLWGCSPSIRKVMAICGSSATDKGQTLCPFGRVGVCGDTSWPQYLESCRKKPNLPKGYFPNTWKNKMAIGSSWSRFTRPHSVDLFALVSPINFVLLLLVSSPAHLGKGWTAWMLEEIGAGFHIWCPSAIAWPFFLVYLFCFLISSMHIRITSLSCHGNLEFVRTLGERHNLQEFWNSKITLIYLDYMSFFSSK